MKCGHTTTTKVEKTEPAQAAGSCPHLNVNRSGSTRNTARVYCKDCGTYVSEEPQTPATRAAAKAGPPRSKPSPPLPSGYAPPPQRRNTNIPVDQMLVVASTFKGLVRTYVQKTEETHVTQRQLEKLLEDAIDVVALDSDGGDRSAPRSSGQPAIAMMHHADAPRSSGHSADANVGGSAPVGPHPLYHPNLETVDPATDPRVFALLDEGCNSSCHSEAWIRHAKAAFERVGSHKPVSELDRTNIRSYKGIGDKRSLGSRTIPWGIMYEKLAEDGSVSAQGTIRSNEMSGETPLLISLHAQSTLGFIKDVQAGTCELRHKTGKGTDEYEKIPIRLYNLKGSGLRAICISDFPTVGQTAEHLPPMSFAAVERSGEQSSTVRRSQSQRALAKSSSISSIGAERKDPWTVIKLELWSRDARSGDAPKSSGHTAGSGSSSSARAPYPASARAPYPASSSKASSSHVSNKITANSTYGERSRDATPAASVADDDDMKFHLTASEDDIEDDAPKDDAPKSSGHAHDAHKDDAPKSSGHALES